MDGWKIGIAYAVVNDMWIYNNRRLMINENIFGKTCDKYRMQNVRCLNGTQRRRSLTRPGLTWCIVGFVRYICNSVSASVVPKCELHLWYTAVPECKEALCFDILLLRGHIHICKLTVVYCSDFLWLSYVTVHFTVFFCVLAPHATCRVALQYLAVGIVPLC
jgi:hypothetical protein